MNDPITAFLDTIFAVMVSALIAIMICLLINQIRSIFFPLGLIPSGADPDAPLGQPMGSIAVERYIRQISKTTNSICLIDHWKSICHSCLPDQPQPIFIATDGYYILWKWNDKTDWFIAGCMHGTFNECMDHWSRNRWKPINIGPVRRRRARIFTEALKRYRELNPAPKEST